MTKFRTYCLQCDFIFSSDNLVRVKSKAWKHDMIDNPEGHCCMLEGEGLKPIGE